MFSNFLKKKIKQFPKLRELIIKLRTLIIKIIKAAKLIGNSNKKNFTNFYLQNKWGNSESFSGDGSTIKQTNTTRKILENVIREYKIKSLLDIPCGDFNWMRLINFEKCNYFGADIVGQIINENRKFEKKKIKFFQCDIINNEINKYDLIFCRDCFVHLSHDDIRKSIDNIIKSKSNYLLTTTFPENDLNERIISGMWRPLNLVKAPFFLPEPTEIFLESKDKLKRKERNKYLGLWDISKLKTN